MLQRSILLLALAAAPLAAQPEGRVIPDSLEIEAYPRAEWTRSAEAEIGLDRLPIRSVRQAAAFLPRVRGNFHSDRLVVGAHTGVFNPRAEWYPYLERAGQEPVFVVDGVRVADGFEVPFEAVATIEALAGFVSARYGEAASGLILVETREGMARYGGEVEVGTSEVVDDYGHRRAAFSVGGPLGSAERGRFSVSGAWQTLGDASPYGIETYRLRDADFEALQQNPQVLRLVNDAGDQQFIPFPSDLVPQGGIDFQTLAAQIGDRVPAGFRVAENEALLGAAETYTADRFERGRGKDDPLRDLRLYGSASFQATQSVELHAGGGLQRERADNTAAPAERWAASLYARDQLYQAERDAYAAWGRIRQTLTPTTFYEVRVDYQHWDFVQHPSAFSSDVSDVLFYGDIDDEASAVARRYAVLRDGRFETLYTQDGGSRPGRVGGVTFFSPGWTPDRYRRRSGSSFTVAGHGETKVGIHRVAFGAEFERQTRRAFEVAGASLARFYADGAPEAVISGAFPEGVSSYEDLPFDAVRPVTLLRYGYDALGLDTVDGQNIDGYYARTDTDVAPYRPIYYAGYIQNRLSWRDLSLDIGLRVSAFDANTEVLLDPYATVPILRVQDVPGALTEAESDWAVYFADGDQVVGYRDTEGQFYNSGGQEASPEDILLLGGQVRPVVGADGRPAPISEAFEASSVDVVVQPRFGASLKATDHVLVFAHYARQARRPPPQLYVPFSAYEGVTGQSVVGNARLRPEILDAFGIGTTLDVHGLRVTASLFYDRHYDRPVERRLVGGFPGYKTIVNVGTLATYGVVTRLVLDRSRGFAMGANYTLSYSTGTDSDAATAATVSPNDAFADVTAPADFDVRHTLNAILDYRMPEQAGLALLGGWGAGVRMSMQSGRPYTSLVAPGFSVGDPFTSPVAAALNEARRPWLHRLDVWVDKPFEIGSASATAFLWIENVLGASNRLALYRATGQTDSDGFLGTAEGQVYLASTTVEGRAFNYATYVASPANVGESQSTDGAMAYGRPRQVRLGLRLQF